VTDVVDERTRSRMMAGIRSANTRPELLVRSALHRQGLRFARSSLGLAGRPDVVRPHWKVAVFVNGCFWHMHGCKLSKLLGSNTDFWSKKLQANQTRDFRNMKKLTESEWRVLTVWECSLLGAGASRLFDQRADQVVHCIRDHRAGTCCDVSQDGIFYRKTIDESH
jgi:DNA mismatch endonuclease (patch repair protein)